ncbi:MFS transporter [Aeromicrobium stalagmiti]|uniref:MFS transporter n=1 Tax=Aeromicrobium stalagmiti TaxID=2738988 RepID=UPI00156A336B|nr:MFS transporter [Aeromicrobium stalagmiti]NRQ49143.1 MFS transporter [Aeromicrobium stalagmiti]
MTPRSSDRAHPRTTIVVLAVGVGSFGLLQSLVVPVLSLVQDRFDTDQATTAWVLTSYLLSAAVATPLIGRIGDAVGKQRMLIVTLTLLAVGSAMAALAPSIEWMIVARVVQGMGGGVLPLSFGIIRDEVSPRRAATAVGIIASLVSAAFGIGIVLAGPIVDVLGYTWLFWLPAIFTGLAALGTLLLVPESPVRMAGRISILPAVLLSSWLVLLLLALSEGNDQGWTSGVILGMLAAAVVTFGLWVRSEQRARVPLIDIQLMRTRGVWTANAVAFVAGLGTFASLGFLPQLLQTPTASGYGFGASISESGLILLPSSVMGFVMGFVAPRLVRRFSARAVICVGAVSNTLAFTLVALLHEETWQISLWMLLQGIGVGCVVSSLAGVVLGSVPPEQSGVASGMNANIRLIGGSLGSAMMAGIVTARADANGFPLEAGYRDGFLVLAVGALLAAGAALLIPRTPGRAVVRSVDESAAQAQVPV